MSEHGKIEKAKGPSLLERADKAFGFAGTDAGNVPADLPKASNRKSVLANSDGVQRSTAGQSASTSETAESSVELCGPPCNVNRDRLRREGLIVPEDPVTGLLEEFRIVKRELIADARSIKNKSARRILISSPHPEEGKTYCAVNLAIALAGEQDFEVLLIDGDVINPSVLQKLGIETEAGDDVEPKGFVDALADPNVKAEGLALKTDIDRLFVMRAGTNSARHSELLASARTGEVLDRLTAGAPNRFVIFDTPPALAASPAAELAAHVGQTVLVVRAGDTGRAALEDARQLLSACPDIKLLLNAAQFSPSGRRFGDYGDREDQS